MNHWARFVLFLFFLLLLLPASMMAAIIEGRVLAQGDAVAGLSVVACREPQVCQQPLAQTRSDESGYFQLQVAAGPVAVFGLSPQLFAFSGRTPLRLAAEDKIWLGLQAVPRVRPHELAYEDEYTAALQGQVLLHGRPQPGAYVSLYLDAAEGLRGQGYRISMPTDAEGRFSFDGLPESSYYLISRWRKNGARVGPLKVGDAFASLVGNPVALKAGRTLVVQMEMVERQPHELSLTLAQQQQPLLQGKVIDARGRPRAGLHVFAYRNPVIGHQRPLALSAETGADGRFRLLLPEAGYFYLGARQNYGDSPAPGELFGLSQQHADHGVQINTGNNEEISIMVEEIRLD